MTRQNAWTASMLTLGLLLPLASLRPVSGFQKSPGVPPPVLAQKPSFVVVVDAGHGGQDTGAVAPDGTLEKDISLAIALKLQKTLTKLGARVIMTRTDDTFLPVMARPALVSPNHAQYFVSIHCDNHEPANSRSGLTAYYHGTSTTGQMLASDILHNIARDVVSPTRSNVSDMSRFPGTGFGVLRGSPVPAVLIGCGYMNNSHDLMALRQPETQQKIADGIAAGLEQFNIEYPPIRHKTDYVAAVHAHNTKLILFWNAVAVNSDVILLAIKQHKPEQLANSMASSYVFNGHTLTKQQAVQQLRSQIQRYGSQYEMKIVKVISSATSDQMTLISTERWGAGKNGAESLTLSRQDVWIKTAGGWKLASTDVK